MSNIVSSNIDENYPVAGIDNDSQGFRDNFNQIKIALSTANAEITDLETTAARLNVDNNFNGAQIQNALFYNTTLKSYSQATAASIPIYWNAGQFQTVNVAGNLTLTLTGWPNVGNFGKLRVAILGDGANTYTVTFEADDGNNIKHRATDSLSVSILSDTNPKIFDFWTIDNGSTVYAEYIGEFS